MKKLLCLLALLSLSLSSYSQTKLVKIRRTTGQRDVLYLAYAPYNPNVYPQTMAGKNAYELAASTGAFSLTTQAGCVIPAGNRPPVLPPTCSQSVDWLSAWYTWNPGTLFQVAAYATEDVQAKFEREDGTAFSGANPGGVVVSSGSWYDPGPLANHGQYTREWTTAASSIVSGKRYKITWRKKSNNSVTFSFTFQPSAGTEQQLFVASNNSTTTPPGSGTSGGGGGNTGSNPTTTAYFANGFGEGSLSQLMQSAPFVPLTNQLSSWPAGPTYQYLQNSEIKFGIAKFGGAITHLSYHGGKNWINTVNTAETQGTFYDPPGSTNGYLGPDPGSSGGWSMYGTPGHAYVQADATGVSHNTNAYYDTGMNVVIGGSAYHNYSPVTWFERRTVAGFGEVMYCRSTPLVWALPNTIGASTYHMWWWLEGQRVKGFSIIENNRTDNQRSYEGREQEGPFIFGTADLYHHYVYEGGSPGTGGGLTDITLSQPIAGSPTDGRRDGPIRYATEGWIGCMDDSNKGIVLLLQHNSRIMNRQEQDRGGDEFSNAKTYINSAMMMNYDSKSCTAFGFQIFAGYLNDFRSWYNSTTIGRPDFSWNFTQPGSLCGWWSQNAPADFNSNNRYSLNIGKRSINNTAQARFYSPSGIWKASDMPQMYVKGVFTGGTIQNLRLHWTGPGIENGNDAYKDFSISTTGNEQTITIMPGWSGLVTSVWFELQNINQSTSGSEQFIPTYIGKNNPATNGLSTLLLLSLGAGTMLRKRKRYGVRQRKPMILPTNKQNPMKRLLSFLLCLSALTSLAQPAVLRLSRTGDMYAFRNASGNLIGLKPASSVMIDKIGASVQVSVNDKTYKIYDPTNIQDASGNSYGNSAETVLAALEQATPTGGISSGSSSGTLVLATQAQATAGTDNGPYMSPLRTAQAITAYGYQTATQVNGLISAAGLVSTATYNSNRSTDQASAANASNLSTGTLPDARLNDVGTAGTIGGGSVFINSITRDAKGRITGVTTGTPAGGGGTSSTRQTVTSGSTSTIADASGNINYYINPASTLATHAAKLPATAVDNQVVSILFGGTITSGIVVTSFSVLPNTGQTLLQATSPSSVQAGESVQYVYNSENQKWYRKF